jgi:hypothetical protein
MRILDEIWHSFAICGVVLGGGSYAQLRPLIESRPASGPRPAPLLTAAPPVPPARAAAATEALTAAIRSEGPWRQWRPLAAPTPN